MQVSYCVVTRIPDFIMCTSLYFLWRNYISFYSLSQTAEREIEHRMCEVFWSTTKLTYSCTLERDILKWLKLITLPVIYNKNPAELVWVQRWWSILTLTVKDKSLTTLPNYYIFAVPWQVWVLTGDKEETAVNISHAAGHFTPDMVTLSITRQRSSHDCADTIIKHTRM